MAAQAAEKHSLGMEFLARGAMQYNEPGVCVSFDETADELARNVASLGFDVNALISRNASRRSWSG